MTFFCVVMMRRQQELADASAIVWCDARCYNCVVCVAAGAALSVSTAVGVVSPAEGVNKK